MAEKMDAEVDAELLKLKEEAYKHYKNPIEGTDYAFYCNPMEREDVGVQFGKIRLATHENESYDFQKHKDQHEKLRKFTYNYIEERLEKVYDLK